MYRFIGIMKLTDDEAPYKLLLSYKDFKDKKSALKRLDIYNRIDIPKATFTIIDRPVSIDNFFDVELSKDNKDMYAYESLLKLEKILNMETVENKSYKEVEVLFGGREVAFELFEDKAKEYKEIGNVFYDRGYEENIILGEPKLEVEQVVKK